MESLEMISDENKFDPGLTSEEQKNIHQEVSKKCLQFLVDNFIDMANDDVRKTPIVATALTQIILEFSLNLAPDKILGFALLHQVLAAVSISQLRTSMEEKMAEFGNSLTEEQKEELEKIFGIDKIEDMFEDVKKSDILH